MGKMLGQGQLFEKTGFSHPAFICSYLAYRTATILMVISYLPAVRARTLSGSLAEALMLFVLGFLTGTVLYAATSVCEGALSQRRALWDYFCRTIKDQQSMEMTADARSVNGAAEFLRDLP